jgi:hypothetical protein
MIDRDVKSTLVTKIIRRILQSAPYSGSEPQLFVCWLSAAICEGIVLICKASLFIHTRKSLQSFAGAALSSRAEAMGSSGQCKVTTAIQRSS